MKKNKILLLYRGPQKEARDDFTSFVPSGLFNILFFLLKNGINAELYNLSDFKAAELRYFVRHNQCGAALISSFYGNHIESMKLARMIKAENPRSVTVLGGPFAILSGDILRRAPEIDFVIRGEGELSALNLIRHIVEQKVAGGNISGLCFRKNGEIHSNPSFFHDNIDDFFYLPSQVVKHCHFVDPEIFSILISSRGCPDRCNFCASPMLWQNRIRHHAPELMIKYLKDLRQTTGALYFSIRDDNFLVNKKRVIGFAKMLAVEKLYYLWNTQSSARFIDDSIAAALHNAGCDQVQMGIESGSPALLSFLNKRVDLKNAESAINTLRRHLIRPFGYFIGGMNETSAQAKETAEFIKNSGIIDGVLSPLVIYPGTHFARALPPGDFFSGKEILYYAKDSYLKYRDHYLAALAYASEKHVFSGKELSAHADYHYSTNIAKHFHCLAKGDYPAAAVPLDEIISREPQNPWPHLLSGKLYNELGNRKKAKHLFTKANALLEGKNAEIRDGLSLIT